jgi:hypothetical protein
MAICLSFAKQMMRWAKALSFFAFLSFMVDAFYSPECIGTNSEIATNSFKFEKPQTDNGTKRIYKGELNHSEQLPSEPYALSASKKPLLNGVVTQHVPLDWQGKWQGSIQSSHATGSVFNKSLEGFKQEALFDLETSKEGRDIFNLSVRKLTQEAEDRNNEPKKVEEPNMGKPDDIPNIHFFYQNGEPAVIISGVGTEVDLGLDKFSDTNNKTLPGNGTTVFSGGIRSDGPACFKGRYFKADYPILLAGAHMINERIDIGHWTLYTHGVQYTATGNGVDGYTLTPLRNGAAPIRISLAELNGVNQKAPAQIPAQVPLAPAQIFGGSLKTLSQEIFRIEPNIYDVKSTALWSDENGRSGTQVAITRFTGLSGQRMIVQITLQTYDRSSRLSSSWDASGYLVKQ